MAMHAQEGFLAQLARVLGVPDHALDHVPAQALVVAHQPPERTWHAGKHAFDQRALVRRRVRGRVDGLRCLHTDGDTPTAVTVASAIGTVRPGCNRWRHRSDEHPSELQSLMRISYAVSCL